MAFSSVDDLNLTFSMLAGSNLQQSWKEGRHFACTPFASGRRERMKNQRNKLEMRSSFFFILENGGAMSLYICRSKFFEF